MPDVDVQAISLSVPSTSAPVATYRPAVLVKNNGVNPANVSGSLRIYDKAAGTLLQTMTLTAAAVPAGATRSAVGSGYWTALLINVGKHYLFLAEVTTPGDQVPSNNYLGPIDVVVSAEEPPPPQPVEDHASQHENGGGDELNLDGLPGILAEGQRPTDHAENHEEGGSDQISVAGLSGLLATPQTPAGHAFTHEVGGADPVTGIAPAAHHTSHEPGGVDEIAAVTPGPHAATHSPEGGDEINVAGLSGTLADPQPPQSHAASHEPTGSDEIDGLKNVMAGFSDHVLAESGVHDSALNLEHIANKGAASGYCPLGPDSIVPGPNLPTQFPTAHNTNHEKGGIDEISVEGLAGVLQDDQPPIIHGDASHVVEYEKTSARDEAGGYPSLDGNAKINPLRLYPATPAAHHTTHEPGGDDALSGVPPTAHASSHLPAGSDPISIAWPVHNNDYHSQSFITEAALEDYQATIEKGAANGYCPLGADAKVPEENLPVSEGGGRVAYALASPSASQDISAGGWVSLISAALPQDEPDGLHGFAIIDLQIANGTVADDLTASAQIIVDGYSSGTAEQDYKVNSPLDVMSLSVPFSRSNPPQLGTLTVRVMIAGLSQGVCLARCSCCLLIESES